MGKTYMSQVKTRKMTLRSPGFWRRSQDWIEAYT